MLEYREVLCIIGLATKGSVIIRVIFLCTRIKTCTGVSGRSSATRFSLIIWLLFLYRKRLVDQQEFWIIRLSPKVSLIIWVIFLCKGRCLCTRKVRLPAEFSLFIWVIFLYRKTLVYREEFCIITKRLLEKCLGFKRKESCQNVQLSYSSNIDV